MFLCSPQNAVQLFSLPFFGLEWEKRKIVRRMHVKRILQTAPHEFTLTPPIFVLTLTSLGR